MGKLLYSMLTSLDGYVADAHGDFKWAEPSEEVHQFINNIERHAGTFLLGRKMYETLAVWDTIRDTDSEAMNQYADIWRDSQKVVYSTSLLEAATAKTTIEKEFNPDVIQKWLSESDKDFVIGGPHLAAEAIKADIVDEVHQFIAPIIVGEGTYWLPQNLPVDLQLIDIRRFENGFAYLHYKLGSRPPQ